MYKIIKRKNIWIIKENSTQFSIAQYKTQDQAKALCDKLNKGSGFGGATPLFLVRYLQAAS